MCICVCVKSSPKVGTFLNFSKSLLLDCHFNIPNLTPFCIQNVNLLFSVLLMLCFQKYSCHCSYFILDLLLIYTVTTTYLSDKTKDFLNDSFNSISSITGSNITKVLHLLAVNLNQSVRNIECMSSPIPVLTTSVLVWRSFEDKWNGLVTYSLNDSVISLCGQHSLLSMRVYSELSSL